MIVQEDIKLDIDQENGKTEDKIKKRWVKVLERKEQFVDNYMSSTRSNALRIVERNTGNNQDASDIVQETMEIMLRNCSKYLRAEWEYTFYRVLQNQIQDWDRREKIRMQWHTSLDEILSDEDCENSLNLAVNYNSLPSPEYQLFFDESIE